MSVVENDCPKLTLHEFSNPTFDTQLLPISKVIHRQKWIYCETKTSPLDVASIIDTSGSQFARGATAKGIASIIQFSLNALLGSSGASMATEEF